MGVLILFCFCDVLSGIPMREWSKDEWYREGAKRVWLIPPWWVFPVVWTALYILIITSLYIFYRSVAQTGGYGRTVDVVSVVFFANIILNKLWPQVFFRYRSPGWALLVCAGILGTGITILYFFGANDYMDSCWIFLIYVIWTAFAFLLNLIWWWKMRKEEKMGMAPTVVTFAKENDTVLEAFSHL